MRFGDVTGGRMPMRLALVLARARRPNGKADEHDANKAGLTVPGAFRTILPTPTLFRGGKMPKIRHLAIKTKDPARLAKFYEEVFGLKVIHSERSGAMYMSDGYL